MSREEIFSLLQDCILSIVPDVSREQIVPDRSLKQLGVDSIDRSDIATALTEKLGIPISSLEIGKPRDLGTLVEILEGEVLEGLL
ncbi:phosphopantetheine-binding protein [Pendulispora rubella]|uniref:Phosphopantetheine-binding protein n=1 Tax=Pendulispora rubella TaxID=2741070 RepID=A0ABZ2L3L7_9BACT